MVPLDAASSAVAGRPVAAERRRDHEHDDRQDDQHDHEIHDETSARDSRPARARERGSSRRRPVRVPASAGLRRRAKRRDGPQRDQPADGDDQRAEPDPRDERRDDQQEVDRPRMGDEPRCEPGDRPLALGADEREVLRLTRLGRCEARHQLLEHLVATVDLRVQRLEVRVDDRPDVLGRSRPETDDAVRRAVERLGDRARRSDRSSPDRSAGSSSASSRAGRAWRRSARRRSETFASSPRESNVAEAVGLT